MNTATIAAPKTFRWWFGQTRTIEQQMTGLNPLMRKAGPGISVLDVGCAEGAISHAMALQGCHVMGIEIVPEYVTRARSVARVNGLPCRFERADANDWVPPDGQTYDVVLLLGVLHKLRDPSMAARRLAACARQAVVVRLPPAGGPVITDPRSGNEPHNIEQALALAGFRLAFVTDGPVAEAGAPEWCGYFARAA